MKRVLQKLKPKIELREYSYDTGAKKEEYTLNGRYHNTNDRPALIEYDIDGNISSEMWYQKGHQHRIGNPAVIKYYTDGTRRLEKWYQKDRMHRIGNPARISYYENGNIAEKAWYLKDQLLRLEGYYKDGKKRLEEWYTKGRLDSVEHRIDGPAKIRYYENGKEESEDWYKEGKLHRIGGPATMKYYEDGKKKKEVWFIDGKHVDGLTWKEYHHDGTKKSEIWYLDDKLHRVGGPALMYYKDGKKKKEAWYIDGKHVDGLSSIEYYKDGDKASETWYEDGKKHREDAPAVIQYYKGGEKQSETWYKEGHQHRETAPAEIRYYPDGTKEETWFIYGKRLSDSEVIAHKQRLKHYTVLLGPNYENRVFFDVIEQEDVTVDAYLNNDPDNIIIVMDGKTLFGTLRTLLSTPSVLYECAKPNSMAGIIRDEPFLSLALLGCPCIGVIKYKAAQHVMVKSDYRIFAIRDSGNKTKTLVSHAVLKGGDVVSDAHCQSGTNMGIYEIYVPLP